LADRYIKVEFGIELPQDWADEIDDLSKSLEPPLKIFRTTSKDFDTKIVYKTEDNSSAGGKASPAEPLPKAKTSAKKNNGEMTPAGKEFFEQFRRKRWATPRQRETFEETEKEVGTTAMLAAVKWAAENGIAKVPAICKTAKKIAGQDNGSVKLRF